MTNMALAGGKPKISPYARNKGASADEVGRTSRLGRRGADPLCWNYRRVERVGRD